LSNKSDTLGETEAEYCGAVAFLTLVEKAVVGEDFVEYIFLLEHLGVLFRVHHRVVAVHNDFLTRRGFPNPGEGHMGFLCLCSYLEA
jgi:hypothetical protein